MDSSALSATLPENRTIRGQLVSVLRERFGERLFVWQERVALVSDEFAAKDKVLRFDAAAQTLLSRAGVKLSQGETLCVIGKTAEERKLARFVAANPSDAFRRESGMVALVRRTGAAEFWAALAPDKTGTRCVLFIGAERR